MTPGELRFVWRQGGEATISRDGSHGDYAEYFVFVSIAGPLEVEKKCGAIIFRPSALDGT